MYIIIGHCSEMMYLWNEYPLISSLQNSPPLTELPTLSRGGDHKQMPITFGTITSWSDDTELSAAQISSEEKVGNIPITA